MDDEPTEEEVAGMAAWLEADQLRREQIESLPYDGVHGLPPDWIAPADIDRFRRTRDYLLDISPSGFVAEQIANHLAEKEIVVPGATCDPLSWIKHINELAHIYYGAQLAPEKGLKVLSGDDAARGYKTISKAREGHEAIHGTKEEKADRWQKMQRRVDEKMTRHSRLSYDQAMRQVAQEAKRGGESGYSLSSLKRHTTNPNRI